MKIEEWFDPLNIEHIKAYRHLELNGFWPEGFLPEEIELPTNWQIILINKFAKLFIDLRMSEEIENDPSLPYIYKRSTEIKAYWNPKYDQDKLCKCGHPYHRHFDGYDDNEAVGCKYCSCYIFEAKDEL